MQLRGCPSCPVLPKNRTKKKKKNWTPCYTHKTEAPLAVPRGEKYYRQKVLIHSDLGGEGAGAGEGKVPTRMGPSHHLLGI